MIVMSLQQIRTELHDLIESTGDQEFLQALLILAKRQQAGEAQITLSSEEVAAVQAGLRAAQRDPLKTTQEIMAKYGR